MAIPVSGSCCDRTHYNVHGSAFSLRRPSAIPGPVSAYLSETVANQLIVAQQRTLVNYRYRGALYSAIGTLLDEWNTSTTFCRVDNYVVVEASTLDVPFATVASSDNEDSWDCLVSICTTCVQALQIPTSAIWSEVQVHNLEQVVWNTSRKQYLFQHSEKCVNCYLPLNSYEHCTQCETCLRKVLPDSTLAEYL